MRRLDGLGRILHQRPTGSSCPAAQPSKVVELSQQARQLLSLARVRRLPKWSSMAAA